MLNAIVFFDLETSGLEPERHDVVQVAAVAVDWSTGAELGCFERKLQFDVAAASPRALEVNGYTPEAWAEAVPQRVGLLAFEDFLGRFSSVERRNGRTGGLFLTTRLAGHNVVKFDLPFLAAAQKRAGIRRSVVDYVALDTLQLALWRWPLNELANHQLGTVYEALTGKPLEGAHDALADVRGCVEVCRRLTVRSVTAGAADAAAVGCGLVAGGQTEEKTETLVEAYARLLEASTASEKVLWWLATDRSGQACAFRGQPTRLPEFWNFDTCICLDTAPPAALAAVGGWEKSLAVAEYLPNLGGWQVTLEGGVL